MPDKPFFVYFAPARPTRRITCPRVVGQVQGQVRRRLGQAARGDVRQAEETGRHPDGRRPDGASPGDTGVDEMPAEMKPVLARQMEIYAGFLEQVDHYIGQLVDTLDDLNILDDTLIYLIIGDNGGVSGGTINGCFNEMTTLKRHAGDRDDRVSAQQDR
jgi:arylsulfatase